mgnify:CR=1 FL=1
MKTVKLITCNDAAQAHIIQGALENEGISSLLHNENMSTLLRGYINDIAGVDVLVDEADYEAAVRLLEQNEMIPEQLKYCPFCGSSDIKFVLKKEHRVRAVMSAICWRPPLREIIIGSMSAMPVEESLKSRLQNFIRLKYDP